MTGHASLAARLARVWLPGPVSDRDEVARTVEASVAGRSRRAAVIELAAIGALGLRLRARIAAGDSTRLLLAHGATLGARSVLALTAVFVTDGGAPPAPVAVAVAGLLVAATARPLVVRLGAPASVLAFWLAAAAAAPPVLLAGTVVASALTVGALAVAGDAGHWLLPTGAVASIGVAGAALVAATAAGALGPAALVVLAATGPVLLLGAGWFDPRLAVAATAVWLWRLAATDLVALVAELGDVGRELTIDVLVVRWLTMATGVIAGIVVSRQALARARSPL